MIKAIDTAIAGLNNASAQINRSAQRIASSTALSPVSSTSGGQIPSQNAPQGILAIQEQVQDGDLVSDIVNLKTASLSYQANLKTIETVNDLFDELLVAFDD